MIGKNIFEFIKAFTSYECKVGEFWGWRWMEFFMCFRRKAIHLCTRGLPPPFPLEYSPINVAEFLLNDGYVTLKDMYQS